MSWFTTDILDTDPYPGTAIPKPGFPEPGFCSRKLNQRSNTDGHFLRKWITSECSENLNFCKARKFVNYLGNHFLALLDYVSRAHEIEICPSSVRRPSVVRFSVRVAIIPEPTAQISLKFWLLLPLGYTLGRFLN